MTQTEHPYPSDLPHPRELYITAFLEEASFKIICWVAGYLLARVIVATFNNEWWGVMISTV